MSKAPQIANLGSGRLLATFKKIEDLSFLKILFCNFQFTENSGIFNFNKVFAKIYVDFFIKNP